MKTKFFAAALAALTLATAGAASAQDFRRGDRDWGWQQDFHRLGAITVRKDGRVMRFDRGDRMFYRLMDAPYRFIPGLTYSYTDRCNRYGCVAFVSDGWSRRPIDRIFAPHLRYRGYAWRQSRDFDRNYGRFGDYDRDDRYWNNEDERSYRDSRDGRFDDRDDDRDDRDGDDDWLEGGPSSR